MWKFMEANPDALASTVKEGVDKVINSNKDYAFILESTMNEYFNQRKPCTTVKVRIISNCNLLVEVIQILLEI